MAYTTIPRAVKNYVGMSQKPHATPTTMIHIAGGPKAAVKAMDGSTARIGASFASPKSGFGRRSEARPEVDGPSTGGLARFWRGELAPTLCQIGASYSRLALCFLCSARARYPQNGGCGRGRPGFACRLRDLVAGVPSGCWRRVRVLNGGCTLPFALNLRRWNSQCLP